MEGEIQNFMMVWISAVLSLCYCHLVGKIISKGIIRLFAIFPVIFLFLFLPLNLSTIFLGGPTSFFLCWLANFKLLLFAFNQGPLSTYPPLSLQSFISLACLPIEIQQNKACPPPQITKGGHNKQSPLTYATKVLLLATFVPIYNKKEQIHSKIVLLSYCIYLYVGLESVLALVATLARACLGLELEPQFNEPYLATSLQDFWGRRWNLMVTSILHPTVYNPVKSISSRLVGKKWAPVPGVLATFFVSGIMHELIFYYIGRQKPTWELTCFFLAHGVCLAIEICVKKALNGMWSVPRGVSRALALAFVVVTALWLFMPQLLRCKADVKVLTECIAFINFVNGVARDVRVPAVTLTSRFG